MLAEETVGGFSEQGDHAALPTAFQSHRQRECQDCFCPNLSR